MHIHSLAEFNYNYFHEIVARVLVLLSTCAIRHLLCVGVCTHMYQVGFIDTASCKVKKCGTWTERGGKESGMWTKRKTLLFSCHLVPFG